MTLQQTLARLTELEAVRRRLTEELKSITERTERGEDSPGLKQRAGNVITGIGRLDEQIREARETGTEEALKGGPGFSLEPGDQSAPIYDPSRHAGPGSRKGSGSGWGEVFLKAAGSDGGGFKALVPSGSVVVPSLTAGIVRTADRPRSILEMIPVERLTDTDQYSFLRETVRTHNAAPVAVGATKPTSVYSVERVDATAQTIAHLSERIPRQTLADARLLTNYVEGSLHEGVLLALESQVVDGNGTSPNLRGMRNTVGIQAQAFATNILITTRKALTKLEAINIPGGAYVLAPADWEAVELFADSTGDFIMGDQVPVDRARRLLWGQPVVTSSALTAGAGVLVDFAGSTQLWEREGVRVDWSENTYDAVAA
ncbi:MAG: phage major capsid protein, partial [Acidimicrobiales bacterium]|nr:phage major capsid protein [Acidimicrobiales bacterium]